MNYHTNATTNKVQRQLIQQSTQTVTELSDKFCTSTKTIRKWKHRSTVHDASSRPHVIHYALTEGEQDIIVVLRKLTGAPSYDIADAVKHIIPNANQSNISRTLQRKNISKKPKEEKGTKKFKDYEPGFIHIDLTYVPQLEGKKKYLYVAVDRATRIMYVELRSTKSMKDSTAFLKACKRFFPFKIDKVLTDNGFEFTNKRYAREGKGNVKKTHEFTKLCNKFDVEHRLTKIKSPWTNGMVERVNGLIKEHTVKIHRYRNYREMEKDFKNYELRYNVYRKHNSLRRKTPYEQMVKWFEKKPELFWQNPSQWLLTHYREQPGDN
jgi:transposase-like protein